MVRVVVTPLEGGGTDIEIRYAFGGPAEGRARNWQIGRMADEQRLADKLTPLH